MTLEEFLRPLYQDLDGVSRFESIERLGRIARTLHPPSRELDLLILFSGLGKWLEKPRNLSRILLAVPGMSEEELKKTAASIRRLENPDSEMERAVAAAMMIDAAGLLGLAQSLADARREGNSIADVARQEPPPIPEWMSQQARDWILQRREERARFCRRILDELGC